MDRSEVLFRKAREVIPGGVNSPVRAFRSVGGTPRFISRAAGARIYDVDGREYIDYVASWGPMILGHAHPAVIEAVIEAARRGTSYGAPTESEIDLAETITRAFPSIQKVRLVSSGTEAVMSAIRLARGYTGRSKIIKFEGCYHGHADSMLVKAGSGVATFGIPGSPGVPAELAALTVTAVYNDIDSVRQALERHAGDVAGIIVEPVAGNMGVVAPRPGFLEALREISRQEGIVLIFDEVITGFRVAYGGFQTLAGIDPDLTCLGKIIGGGLPVGAFGGRRDIMDHLAPDGPVYQAGTLSGNPLATAAGRATLEVLRTADPYGELERKGERFAARLKALLAREKIPAMINRVGSMMTLFFTGEEVFDFASALKSDTKKYAAFFGAMLAGGVNLAPSQFEAVFLSAAHTDSDLDKTLEVCAEALEKLRKEDS